MTSHAVRRFYIITVRNKVAKVIFSQACVCPRWGGACSGGGVPGPGGCAWSRGSAPGGGAGPRGVLGPGGSTPGGCLVLGVPALGGVCLVLGGVCSRGGAWSWEGVPGPGGLVSQHALRQTPLPPGETATAADGTHPTGIHSC